MQVTWLHMQATW